MLEIKSPFFKELAAEIRQRSIILFLEGRFGAVPSEIERPLKRIKSEKRLQELIKAAAVCADLAAFQRCLESSRVRTRQG